MKCVLCIVIKGVVVSSHFIAKSVKEIIAKNKEKAALQVRSTNGVIIPPPEVNQGVFPQPVPESPNAQPAPTAPNAQPIPSSSNAQSVSAAPSAQSVSAAPSAQSVSAAPNAVASAGSVPAPESLPMATPVPPEVVAQLSSNLPQN